MSSDFVCWLCLGLNAETFTGKRFRFFRYHFRKKKNSVPKKWALALKASCFLPNKVMDRNLVPLQRVVLTLQNETNPGPVAQFFRMQCFFKVHGACRWKWNTWGCGGSPFNIQQSTYSIWWRQRYHQIVFGYQLSVLPTNWLTNKLTRATKKDQQGQVRSARQHLWTVPF